MADFQSSKTAAEIEEVLTGALTYKSSQTLTETEKAFVREKIGATELGEGIKIVSHFDSLDELEAAVPNPNAGAAYSIGTELPYNLYVYDFYHDTWVNHGPIRANDITARFAQNAVVAVGAWEEDAEVFTDYTYKAAITLAEVTGNDFPIVAFSPSDAVGGNYAPICFAFDGYIEIWARAIPDADIIVPAITFIIMDTEDGESGNSTKGITNASGGIATGGVSNAMLADGAVTGEKIAVGAVSQIITATVPIEGWEQYVNYATNVFMVDGLASGDNPIVDLNLTGKTGEELVALTEAWGNVLRAGVDSSGQFYIYFSEIPTVEIPIKIMVVRK